MHYHKEKTVMKRITKKKLELSTATVRHLTADELSAVAGARTGPPSICVCDSDQCSILGSLCWTQCPTFPNGATCIAQR